MSVFNMLIAALALSAATVIVPSSGDAHAQQTYRWVDAQGNVTYSDRPPPDGIAVEVDTRGGTASTTASAAVGTTTATAAETLSMGDAAARSPITLFAVSNCSTCDLVRMYLRERGVPFSDVDVEGNTAAQARLEELIGRLEVPTVSIGDQVLDGFSRTSLDGALRAAGYPEANGDVATDAPPIEELPAEPTLETPIPDDLLDGIPGS